MKTERDTVYISVSTSTVVKVILTAAVTTVVVKSASEFLARKLEKVSVILKRRAEEYKKSTGAWADATGNDEDSVAAKIADEVLNNPDGDGKKEETRTPAKRSSRPRSGSAGSGRA